jgi:hypothetical protein
LEAQPVAEAPSDAAGQRRAARVAPPDEAAGEPAARADAESPERSPRATARQAASGDERTPGELQGGAAPEALQVQAARQAVRTALAWVNRPLRAPERPARWAAVETRAGAASLARPELRPRAPAQRTTVAAAQDAVAPEPQPREVAEARRASESQASARFRSSPGLALARPA